MPHPTRRDAIRTLAAASFTLAARPLRADARPAGELLIRGGRVVNADGSRTADVRIVDERITEVGRGLSPGPAAQVIDATNRLVLPGGIDPHTHLRRPFADDLTSGSQAALAGGITTVGTFAFPGTNQSLQDGLGESVRLAGAEAIADVFFHSSAWPPAPEVRQAMASLPGLGQPSFKIFMPRESFGAHLDDVIAFLEAARTHGVVTMVHCEDAALLAAAVRRLTAAGRVSLAHYGESRPVIAEVAATQMAAALCESTGAPMHVVHLSSARALEATRAPRARGLPLYVETRPLYLHLTEERMTGELAPLFVGQPPLRTRADAEALWQGLADGSIDVLATDHAPWTRAQKLDPALTISRLRPGVSDLQFMLPLYFSEGVGKRGLPLERFVATTSTNTARIFGLFPSRGVIAPGAVADVVIWDPARTATIREGDDRSNSDYSVYDGWEVTGWPVTTIRRGEIVYANGEVRAMAGSGRVVSRVPWNERAFPVGRR